MTPNDLTTGRRSAGRPGIRMYRLLPALAAVVGCGIGPASFGQDRKEAPKFTGKAIPDAPSQTVAWTSPPTKLPRSLTDATSALFDLGAADPRGCEYREVEIGNWQVEKARGFVMPERPGDTGRFVVGWDGVVRPAISVGDAADLEADVGALAAALKTSRESPDYHEYESVGASSNSPVVTRTHHRDVVPAFLDRRGPETAIPRSPFSLCMLLRLGRADLAESLLAAATGWTPEKVVPDVNAEYVGYAYLSGQWADVLYHRLVASHARGDDVVALDAGRRLDRFRKGVDARKAKRGAGCGFPLKKDRRDSHKLPSVYSRNAG